MKHIAIALLGIGSTLVSGIGGQVQSADLMVNFKQSVNRGEATTSQVSDATPDQPVTPISSQQKDNAPCIACGMG
ncbi:MULTISPECIES: hypothetical protein [unclassified Leptolyngbya]|uniref:hypothetical protein n=1 Tax=unclassified Leptolyngbya TaxID=2650499 RepID=UPI0016896429|nr:MULTISPECIES: hypothetical protein [unclassified Leptolyngbya]MBD1909780.1 hypothetical protein [Leptolyngbya sp. FACHB-8]MBD2157679.1 hypothetical protein [Leptolyngbya sp. FACHB-16]